MGTLFEDLLGETIHEGSTVSFIAKRGNKPAMFVGRVLRVMLSKGSPLVQIEPHDSSIGLLSEKLFYVTDTRKVVVL